jgi:hypothetical protein
LSLLKTLILISGYISLSCLNFSLGFHENNESYYHWRVNRTFDQIFVGTELKSLKKYLYSDDGQGLIDHIKSEGINIESSGYEGINLLNWAVGAQRYRSVEALLEAGADPDYLNDLGIGNLSISILFRDERLIRLLAKHGADMQRSPDRYTLQDAITSHGTELLPLLVELGSDPDYFEIAGNPLVSAVGTTGMESMLLLLDLGASPVSTEAEKVFFIERYKKWPFGHPGNPLSGRYISDLYGELYQRMIEFGVAEPNQAHNEWLIKQGLEPNPLAN